MEDKMSEDMLEQMSTPALQALLREDCIGSRELSPEQVLRVCRILAQRLPSSGECAAAAWSRFLSHYAPK